MRFLLVSVALLSLIGCEPIAIIPGGELSGEVVAVPPSWSVMGATKTVQLETRPADPYSINIWAVGIGQDLYVAAGAGKDVRWTAYIAENPDVRLRLASSIFELRATRVLDEAERLRVVNKYARKYDLDINDNFVEDAWLYRLDPR